MYHVPMCKLCGEHEVGTWHGSTEYCSERCEDVAFHEMRAGEYVRDESQYGGKYHGPTLEAGLTAREYWDSMAEWEDERARLRDEW